MDKISKQILILKACMAECEDNCKPCCRIDLAIYSPENTASDHLFKLESIYCSSYEEFLLEAALRTGLDIEKTLTVIPYKILAANPWLERKGFKADKHREVEGLGCLLCSAELEKKGPEIL